MDHLHEELKQPLIVSDDDDVDVNNSNEKTMTKFVRRCVTPTVDCDTSEPSDTDYETCDSGLSSESNSVVADICPRSDDCGSAPGQPNNAEQLTELLASQNDVVDAAAGSGCTDPICSDVEVSSPPIAAVGDTVSGDPCEELECVATQCRQKSEAGGGEVGTVLTEDCQVAAVPACTDCTASDTTSVLSMSSDSKCAQDSDATSQIVEPTLDTHLPLNRKLSSARERQPSDATDKLSRPLRTADDVSQQQCKRLSGTLGASAFYIRLYSP